MHEPEQPVVECYLPYPAYNNAQILQTLYAEGDVTIGRVQKKGLTETEIGLIVAVAALLISPEWDIQYRTRIRPQLQRALSLINSTLARHSLEADLRQTLQIPNVGAVTLILIPDRTATTTGQEIEAIDLAIKSAIQFVDVHERKDVRELRSLFNPSRRRYEIIYVRYSDGQDLNIAP
jgi:hypothetical protein